MKKLLFSLGLLTGLFAQAQTFNLTLQVDMNQQAVSPLGVHVAGAFKDFDSNGIDDNPALAQWDPAAIVLTDANSDSVYEVTLNVVPGTYEFKFLNGDAWGTDESVPGACATNNNRTAVVVAADLTYATCFALCGPCPTGAPDTMYVKLQVDMSNQDYPYAPYTSTIDDTVSVAGTIQALTSGVVWTPGATMLSDVNGDKVYDVVLRVAEGTYQYKFLNGNAWGEDETVPAACQVGGNREITVMGNPGDTITIPTICYGDCSAACAAVGAPINVTFRVDLTNEINYGGGPFVAGSFQRPMQWDKIANPLADPDGNRIFEYTQLVKPAQWAYKYWLGPAAVNSDSTAETYDFQTGGCGAGNGLGGFNRSLDLSNATQDTILPAYVFNSCNLTTVSVNNTFVKGQNFSLAPNPLTTETMITFANKNATAHEVIIMNMTGQVVYHSKNISNESVSVRKTDLGVSGMYIVRVSNEKGEVNTQKLIVE